MAEGFYGAGQGGGFEGAGGDTEFVCSRGGAVCEGEVEGVFGFCDVLDSGFRAEDDPGVAGGFQEAVDDGLGGVCFREHTAVRLRFERDSSFFKPGDGVEGLEFVEGTAKFAGASGIFFREFGGIEARVGDVAAAATGDFYFGEVVFGALVDGDAGGGIGLGGGDGCEESGGSSSYDGDGFLGRRHVGVLKREKCQVPSDQ